jgi:hypothetical protein
MSDDFIAALRVERACPVDDYREMQRLMAATDEAFKRLTR